MPFIQFNCEENSIKITQNPIGMLSKIYLKNIQNEGDFLMFFHHIEGPIFRMILQKKDTELFAKIDLEMDTGSLKKMFEIE